LDPSVKGQIAKDLLFFSIWTQTPCGKKETATTDSKRKQKKIALSFSIWIQTLYGKKEKRGLNEFLPKLLPFRSKHL
jgi:hypothetical protein